MQMNELTKEIGKWSHRNFGDQVSRTMSVALGSTAPVMGLSEEYGELLLAIAEKNSVDIEDAISDIGIYACDMTSRELGFGNGRHEKIEGKSFEDPIAGIGHAIGQINHCFLKRHQGIRGFSDRTVFREKATAALQSLWYYLDLAAHKHAGKSIEELVEETFTDIVADRDWASNPENAADVSDGPVTIDDDLTGMVGANIVDDQPDHDETE